MVCIPNRDKIVPGMLMGAARANIPTIFISGGPLAAGVDRGGQKVDLISVFEAVGARQAGTIDDARLEELEVAGCPSCGSCSGMFTANSMNCLCEALGIALPGNGTILAVSPDRHPLARAAAQQVLELLRRGIRFRDIVTAQAIDNAVSLDVAMGGSTNTLLHVIAVAHEAGIEYPLTRFNDVAERVPHLAKVSPAWDGNRQWHIQDVDAAGGVSALLKELAQKPDILFLDALTVTGKTVGENIEGVRNLDQQCIRPITDPHSARGSLCVLFGNLAPDRAAIQTRPVQHPELTFRAPA